MHHCTKDVQNLVSAICEDLSSFNSISFAMERPLAAEDYFQHKKNDRIYSLHLSSRV